MNRTLTGLNGRTTANVLFFRDGLLPPPSVWYGAVSPRGFRLSRIFNFGDSSSDDGKKWQLRTVNYGCHSFIVPFVINSGGVHGYRPIVGTPLLRTIGALPPNVDRAAWENLSGGVPLVTVPSPLGELRHFQDWDYERGSSVTIDVRYNLMGHGWALLTVCVELMANLIVDGTISRTAALTKLLDHCPVGIEAYIRNPSNLFRLERELDAVIKALQDTRTMDELAEEWAKR